MDKENRRLLTERMNQLRESSNNRKEASDSLAPSKPIYNQNGSFWSELSLLLRRSFLQLSRNKLHIFIQCFHYTFCGLIVGGTYFGMGRDAKHFFDMFGFCLVVLVYLIYSSCVPAALTCTFL